ncbi:DUF2264 domain-containing protein [Flavobacterium cellulosilyticum]|uniref:DUF2264 domain-containing protein n=1 Tax=Flavobacterium cellulosilyticum TaxID=2541731 RepID=A0A4R5C6X4_9FLAO|nr:DUF2264 domain-containing protein [Flavobacterium cellulosilyticum]TDD93830.1 DUF2264 domain-containing protein [Flavobacterium cellulosilyticum]
MMNLNFLLLTFMFSLSLFSQQKENTNAVFKIVNPDYALSPYTGMTKQHWSDAALYLLEGAFSYIHTLDDPMQFPKQPGKSYPQDESKAPTEKLEGLSRTLFIASPLLKANPDLVINNIKVADYYRYQFAKFIDQKSPAYIVPRSKNGGPSQNLVEYGAIAISLLTNPEVLWNPLPQKQKDALAHSMLSYGDGPTVPSNWKFFNIFVLSFFKDQGYAVNEKLLVEYLQKSLDDYRGEGWYNDNPAYDYYSMWGYQLYGALWSEYFGNKYYPEYAAKFRNNFKDLNANYPLMFSRNGEMIMYGRSNSYRIASIAPLPFMGLEKDSRINNGWLRRISSGVLKQFLLHPDFMKDNVPTLGFYGAFEPTVQVYSCRGSVYWMGKAFLGLLLPDDNPFWTAKENEGTWETEFKKDQVYNNFQEESKILITDYPEIGASEIRAWCHEKKKDDWQGFRSTENYNRLSYNSAFPWQADGVNGEVAMNYVFKNKSQEWEPLRLYTFKKFENGIYYRDAVLETNENIRMNLADIPLPNGILRIDRNSSTEAVSMRLGNYALPQLDKEITNQTRKVNGRQVTIIDNGKYQLAMIPLMGWDKTEVVTSKFLHPESENSIVIDVTHDFDPNQKSNIYVTVMLWKKSGKEFTNRELMPIRKIKILDKNIVVLVNGERKVIEF